MRGKNAKMMDDNTFCELLLSFTIFRKFYRIKLLASIFLLLSLLLFLCYYISLYHFGE